MTHDTGFAPNPYFGILTLATCKPGIRLTKKVGDYIAGFTSEKLCKDVPGNEKLVYIMRVTEKITISEYWNDSRFRCKRPLKNDAIKKRGDNIYKPSLHSRSGFIQMPNANHCDGDMNTDLEGEFVLVSNDFYYFGIAAIDVQTFEIKIPDRRTRFGNVTDECAKLLLYLDATYGQYKNTLIAQPHG